MSLTPHEILSLPAAALPDALFLAGLAPADLAPWEPQKRWDHAMPLLERLQDKGWLVSLTIIPSRPAAQRYYLEVLRNTVHHGRHYDEDTGPEQVCRLALLTTTTPTPRETSHHAAHSTP